MSSIKKSIDFTVSDQIKFMKPLLDRCSKVDFGIKTHGMQRWAHKGLGKSDVKGHFSTDTHIGLSYVAPGTSVTSVCVLDIDDKKSEISSLEKSKKIKEIIDACENFSLFPHAFISSSGTGMHLYFIWDEPQEIRYLRTHFKSILKILDLSEGTGGLVHGEIEIFPKSDKVEEGKSGHYVILPLGFGSKSKYTKSLPIDWELSSPIPYPEFSSTEGAETEFDLDILFKKEPLDLTTDEVLEILSQYPVNHFNSDYDGFLEVMAALHHQTNGSDEGLKIFHSWASKNPEIYIEKGHEIDKKWNSFKSDRNDCKTFATIIKKSGWKRVSAEVESPDFMLNKQLKKICNAFNTHLFMSRPDLLGFDLKYDVESEEFCTAHPTKPNAWLPFHDGDYCKLRSRMDRFGFSDTRLEHIRQSLSLLSQTDSYRIDPYFIYANEVEKGNSTDKGIAERWFIDCFGVKDTPLAREAGKYLWSAMAGRAINNGEQVDIVVVLCGKQGVGKSSGIRAMVEVPEDHYCAIRFDDPDEKTVRNLRRCRLAEISEMNGIKTRASEAIKDFVTRTFDKWVPKYKEFSTVYKRRVVLIGTTNEPDFLSEDPSGQRRWLPLNVTSINLDLIKKTRDQAFAEGVRLYRKNGVAYKKAEELAREVHQDFIAENPIEHRLIPYLEQSTRPYLRVGEIMFDLFGDNGGANNSRKLQNEICKLLRKHNYENKFMRENGIGIKVWVKQS